MDLNGDGIKDVVSGSYMEARDGGYVEGEMYFFAGQGNGKYAAGERLKHTNGEFIRIGPATSVAVTDWNNDGKLDIISGVISGPVKLLLGNGKLQFGNPIDLKTSDGTTIEAHDGGPCVVDWDGDGANDLLLGDSRGTVKFFKATKPAKGEIPMLSSGVELITPMQGFSVKASNLETLELVNQRCGMRTKPSVADWNGDGKLDLLVGDFISIESPPKTLTKEEQAESDRLQKELRNMNDGFRKISERVGKQVKEKLGIGADEEVPEDQRKAYGDELNIQLQNDEEYKKFMEGFDKLYREASKYQNRPTPHGFVWVYLRK